MNRLGWFLFGAAALLVFEALAAILILQAHGVSASEAPSGIEATIARHARQTAMPARAKRLANPVRPTPDVLAAARAHWADHCAACHANDGSGDIPLGKHLYPPAPDMRQPATQNLSDGELFFIIQNGVRLTGMPAWGGSAGDAQDSWKLVHFIRRLPSLTFEERKQMEKLNPRGPDEWKEHEEEEKFLRGEGTDEPQIHHHH
jgi:cbb3-type cytochrome c oxidase subunit III